MAIQIKRTDKNKLISTIQLFYCLAIQLDPTNGVKKNGSVLIGS